jgi:hypothetical protein
MAHVIDVVKLGLTSTSNCSFTKQPIPVHGLGCADDNSPDTQEPDEAKVSRPVLKQRRGQRWPRRLQLRVLSDNNRIYRLNLSIKLTVQGKSTLKICK